MEEWSELWLGSRFHYCYNAYSSRFVNHIINAFARRSNWNIFLGMAYALLGNLPPIVGIYMAFFPVIVYSFLGTSRQVSMGTFAVVCLMTGKVALDRLSYEIQGNATSILSPADLTIQIDAALEDDATKTRMVEIATAISLAVGLWQLVMGIFKLGSLSLLLSPELVSGFTTGAAVHVFTSQIKNLLGVSLTRRSGIFKIILVRHTAYT